MKQFFLSLYGKIITTTLVFLGIVVTACVEYGSPYANYIIKGKVTDRSSKKPIPNMRIIYKLPGSEYGNDTVKTDANGEYILKKDWIFDNKAYLYAQDLDGEENGGYYATDSLSVGDFRFRQTKRGDGRWFEGVFEKNDANFQLKHSTPIHMYGVPSAEFNENEK